MYLSKDWRQYAPQVTSCQQVHCAKINLTASQSLCRMWLHHNTCQPQPASMMHHHPLMGLLL